MPHKNERRAERENAIRDLIAVARVLCIEPIPVPGSTENNMRFAYLVALWVEAQNFGAEAQVLKCLQIPCI